MAIPVIVGVTGGLSGVPDTVLRSGLKALKQGLADEDLPEVIIVCDLLSVGALLRIPGIKVVGIASQGCDEPSVPVGVPCVTGLPEALSHASGSQVVIVDGHQGCVIFDPDVNTVVRYQSMQEPQTAERVFLESVHIPAYTQDGRYVLVYSLVSSIADIELAISQGADGLVVKLTELTGDVIERESTGYQDPFVEAFETLLALSAGKPVTVIGYTRGEDLRMIAERAGVGEQVAFDDLKGEAKVLCSNEVIASVLQGGEKVVVSPSDVTVTKELIRTLPGLGD